MHIHGFLLAREFYEKFAPKKLVKFNGSQNFAYDDETLAHYKNSGNPEIYDFDERSTPYPSITIKHAALAFPHKICTHLAKKFKRKTKPRICKFYEN